LYQEEIRGLVNKKTTQVQKIGNFNPSFKSCSKPCIVYQHFPTSKYFTENIGNGKQMCHGDRQNKQNKFFRDRKQTIKNYKCKEMFGFQKKKEIFAV
jgi:hypothetical protein